MHFSDLIPLFQSAVWRQNKRWRWKFVAILPAILEIYLKKYKKPETYTLYLHTGGLVDIFIWLYKHKNRVSKEM